MDARSPALEYLMIRHQREQLPVGQGGAHVGFLWGDWRKRSLCDADITYMYDCGSLHPDARNRELDKLKYCLSGRSLDLLVLSHLHADHVNGLKYLCGLPRRKGGPEGVHVDTIVLPYLDNLDRVLVFAQALHERRLGSGDRRFLADLAHDPVTTLSRLGVRQIVFVADDGEGSGADAPDPPTPPDMMPVDLPPEKRRLKVDRGPVRKLTESQARDLGSAAPESAGPDIGVLDHRRGLVISSHTIARAWMLQTYVDRNIGIRNEFMRELCRVLRITRKKLEQRLSDPSARRDLLTRSGDVAKLRQAYEALSTKKTGRKNLNLTSMSLYSGPVPRAQYQVWAKIGWATYFRERIGDFLAGCLCTGDADLLDKNRRHSFLAHFSGFLDDVHTLVIPHHGSWRNFHEEVLQNINPRTVLVAAEKHQKWQHPSGQVLQQIASYGLFTMLVTKSENTIFHERMRVGFPMISRVHPWSRATHYYSRTL